MNETIVFYLYPAFLMLVWSIYSYYIAKYLVGIQMHKRTWLNVSIFIIIYSLCLLLISVITPYHKPQYNLEAYPVLAVPIDYLLKYLSLLGCTYMIIKDRWYRIFIYATSFYVVYYAIELILGSLMDVINVRFPYNTESIFRDIIINLLVLLLFYLISIFFKKKNRTPFYNITIKTYLAIIALLGMSYGLSVSLVKASHMIRSWMYYILAIACCIFLLIQMFIMVYITDSRNLLLESDKLNQSYIKLQEEHYETLMDKDARTNELIKDLQDSLFRLSGLNDEGKQEEINQYINTMDDAMLVSKPTIQTNNNMVDAIVNRFATEADNMGIGLKVTGILPDECNIEAFDLCTIFANILTNAIEAVRDCNVKKVELDLKYDQDRIFIREKNNYKGRIHRTGSILLTRKENKEMHGLGLSNIRDSASKYNGEVITDITDKTFTITIVMEYV